MATKPEFRTKATKNDKLLDPIKEFTDKSVFIGVTEQKTGRSPGPGRSGPQPTNAELAYIHENGSPARNIPARPFLRPAIAQLRDLAAPIFMQTAKAEMAGNKGSVLRGLNRVGQMGVALAKGIILAGDFKPLAAQTIRDRARRRAKGMRDGEKDVTLSKRTQTQLNSIGIDAPLLDTKQLYDSISYSIRKNK